MKTAVRSLKNPVFNKSNEKNSKNFKNQLLQNLENHMRLVAVQGGSIQGK